MRIEENVTLDDVKAAKPEMIFYGANTCWWTHDAAHLSNTGMPPDAVVRHSAENLRANSGTPQAPLDEYLERTRRVHASGLPCDPRGGVLFQTDDIEGFLKSAEQNTDHYGKHGIRAFIAAHHANCFDGERHWCSDDWQEYNDALDQLDSASGRPATGMRSE